MNRVRFDKRVPYGVSGLYRFKYRTNPEQRSYKVMEMKFGP